MKNILCEKNHVNSFNTISLIQQEVFPSNVFGVTNSIETLKKNTFTILEVFYNRHSIISKTEWRHIIRERIDVQIKITEYIKKSNPISPLLGRKFTPYYRDKQEWKKTYLF